MSAPAKSRVEWGTARIEIAALRDEIVTGLQAGRSLRAIYGELYAANKISISKTRFYIYVAPIRDALRGEHSNNPLSPASLTTTSLDTRHIRPVDTATPNPASLHQSAIDPRPQVGAENTVASASVVPLPRQSRSRAGGGFKLNRDFNPEE